MSALVIRAAPTPSVDRAAGSDGPFRPLPEANFVLDTSRSPDGHIWSEAVDIAKASISINGNVFVYDNAMTACQMDRMIF